MISTDEKTQFDNYSDTDYTDDSFFEDDDEFFTGSLSSSDDGPSDSDLAEIEQEEVPASIEEDDYSISDFQQYIRSISDIPVFSAEEEQETARKIQAGDKQALQDMVTHNLKLVVHIAEKYGHESNIMDLIQEGNIGLMQAAERFNPNLGWRFSTYAAWWIKQFILREVEGNRNIHLSTTKRIQLKKISKARESYIDAYKREPSIDELSELTDISPQKITELLPIARDTMSLDMPVSSPDSDRESSLGDMLSKDNEEEMDIIIRDMMKDDIDELLNILDKRERNIVELRFGFTPDGRIWTLREISKVHHVTAERIRQIVDEALNKMRAPEYSRKLIGYLFQ